MPMAAAIAMKLLKPLDARHVIDVLITRERLTRMENYLKASKLAGAKSSPTISAGSLTEAQQKILGSKKHLVKVSASKKSFYYSFDPKHYFVFSEARKNLGPKVCLEVGLCNKTGDAALAFCTHNHTDPWGQGVHAFSNELSTLRNSLMHTHKPGSPGGGGAVAAAEGGAASGEGKGATKTIVKKKKAKKPG